jgi:hypothetical protein
VVFDEIHSGIVAHGYLDSDCYRPLVRIRVANKQHRGWVHIPEPGKPPALSAPSLDYRPARSLHSA